MAKYTSKLWNKRVLVLGGTSGIGFCVAEAAAEHGAIVVVASSRQTKIKSTVERIKKNNPDAKISGYPCDLADSINLDGNLKALLEFATKDGKLDHIVTTAGDSLDLPKLEDVTPERFYAMQHVRLAGSAILAKHAMSYLNISNASSFTMTGGVNTWKPGPGWAIAAGAGAGIEGLTRGLAVDMKPVRVNCVAPGAVLTELWKGTFRTEEEIQKVEKMYQSKLLTGEIGRPEDVAESYLYFMKDKFVDGQILLTEGGYLLA